MNANEFIYYPPVMKSSGIVTPMVCVTCGKTFEAIYGWPTPAGFWCLDHYADIAKGKKKAIQGYSDKSMIPLLCTESGFPLVKVGQHYALVKSDTIEGEGTVHYSNSGGMTVYYHPEERAWYSDFRKEHGIYFRLSEA